MSSAVTTLTPEERERLAKIIGEFATQASIVTPEERDLFIKRAVERLKAIYRLRYVMNGDALVEAKHFTDQLEDWIRGTAALLAEDAEVAAGDEVG